MTALETLCSELTATVHSDLAVAHPSSLEELRQIALASALSLAPQMAPFIEIKLSPFEPQTVTVGITWYAPSKDWQPQPPGRPAAGRPAA
ncbi:hypothetical protein [Methylobacterium soli]|uniref:Uncharacterized protein n=1 Tax=Methylobacterium soli TaxID=553447 RepID=A0A6L3SQ70_9HYPH|nr:hypothetical protein [Methylobacterium soli]KAB1072892.1 hypothetical protein F6X53_27735 [Methylobacterium soli]GJE41361.1 hypothetical protein AEGHOMDF_0525 [Methylobacterium soli]